MFPLGSAAIPSGLWQTFQAIVDTAFARRQLDTRQLECYTFFGRRIG